MVYPFWGTPILGNLHIYSWLKFGLNWRRSIYNSKRDLKSQAGWGNDLLICNLAGHWPSAVLNRLNRLLAQLKSDHVSSCFPTFSTVSVRAPYVQEGLNIWWMNDDTLALSLSLYLYACRRPAKPVTCFLLQQDHFLEAFTRKARRWCCIRSAVWPAHRVTHLRSLLSQDGWQPEHDSLRT